MPATPTLTTPTKSSSPPTPYSPVTAYILSAPLDQLGWGRAIIPGFGVGFGGALADGHGFEEGLRRKKEVAFLLGADPRVEQNNMKGTGRGQGNQGNQGSGSSGKSKREGGGTEDANQIWTSIHLRKARLAGAAYTS